MMRAATALAAAVLVLPCAAFADPTSRDPAQAPAGDYVLDGRHASLTAKVSHMGGFSRYAMRFDKLEGSFTYDPATLAATRLTISVDPNSIHTGLPPFDKELTGPGFFNARNYPTIAFVSTAVNAGPDGVGTVTGDLTFMGVTKPVMLDVTFNGVGPGLLGAGTRMGFSGTGKIKRSEFGMTSAKHFAGDEVSLDFEVEFVRK